VTILLLDALANSNDAAGAAQLGSVISRGEALSLALTDHVTNRKLLMGAVTALGHHVKYSCTAFRRRRGALSRFVDSRFSRSLGSNAVDVHLGKVLVMLIGRSTPEDGTAPLAIFVDFRVICKFVDALDRQNATVVLRTRPCICASTCQADTGFFSADGVGSGALMVDQCLRASSPPSPGTLCMRRIGRVAPCVEFFGPLCRALMIDDIRDDMAARLFVFVLRLDAADSARILSALENTSNCPRMTERGWGSSLSSGGIACPRVR
jgi:hypothetical protein